MKYIKRLNIDFNNWDEINNIRYKYYWFINIYDNDVYLAKGSIIKNWFNIDFFKNLKMKKVVDNDRFDINLFFNGDEIKDDIFLIQKDDVRDDFYYFLTNSDTISDKYFNRENIRKAKRIYGELLNN